ncbi:MAG TPA: PP2C family protein-serine/threonine phosphatase [Candidatus Dormibacteraeota bacterium]|nr:PP2C family protein-serine/threonine phosphatase [Candidatus Dormibacteraeota bacterium]
MVTLERLSSAQRAAVIGVCSLLLLAIAGSDYFLSVIQLSPLAAIPILVIAAVTGMRVGLALSVVSGMAFADIERVLGFARHADVMVNGALLAFGYGLSVVLVLLARDSAARAARMSTELRDAKTIHDHLFLDPLPESRHWRIEVAHLPLREVGGDFYEVAAVDGGIHVLIADVSGKGIRAAMLLSALKASLRGDSNVTPSVTMARLNERLMPICGSDLFCTAWYGRFYDDGMVRFCSAGHEPPLLRRRDGAVARVRHAGLPLGVMEKPQLSDRELRISPGEALLLYSDGLSELMSDGRVPEDLAFTDFDAFESSLAEAQRRDDVLAILVERAAVAGVSSRA